MKKSNRKLLSFILFFMLILFSFPAVSVRAAENTIAYEIEELSMTLDIPESIKVITPGVKQSDPLFTDNTFDYIQTMSKIRDNNDYLYGKDIANNFEFEVSASDNQNGAENLNKLSEKKLEEVRSSFSEQDNVFSASVYRSGTFTFIEIVRNTTDVSVRRFYKEYYTVYESMGVTLRIISENSDFSDYELSVIKGIVDSVSFPPDRVFNIDGKLSTSMVVAFAVIVVSFVVLVVVKIRSINKEQDKEKRRLERKLNREKSSDNSDEFDKKVSEDNIKIEQPESFTADVADGKTAEERISEDTSAEQEKNSASDDVSENTDIVENREQAIEKDSSSEISEEENTVDESNNAEKQSEKTDEQPVIESVTETAASAMPEENNSGDEPSETNEPESDEQKYEIDLDAAIANFEVTPERRRERRERFKKKNQKRKKRPFGR